MKASRFMPFGGLIAAAAFSLASTAEAQTGPRNAIYTGGQAGAYHSLFCPQIPGPLAKAYFPGYNCTTSAGTIENIQRVLANPKQIGFVQYDVLARQISEKPELSSKITVMKQLACEGLWIVTKNPSIKNYGDVLGYARRIPFVLPPENSGSTATFQYLQSVDKDGLGRARNIRHVQSAAQVIEQVANGNGGEVGFFVQFADPTNANIKAISERNLSVIPVVNRELVQAKVNDREVYQVQTFSLTAGGFFKKGNEVTTACTPVSIITGNPAAFTDKNDQDDQRDMIQRVGDMPSETFLPKEGSLAAIIRGAKRVTGAVLDEMTAAAQQAKEAVDKQINR